jgi:succinoglycan biosynthesis protein ExoA
MIALPAARSARGLGVDTESRYDGCGCRPTRSRLVLDAPPEGTRDSIRRVSVIMPMLNEGEHVEGFVADIARQDFEGEIELIVADGGSTDGSRERLLESARRHSIAAKVLQNEARWVSQGLNACVRAATGDLLVRLDCHARYPPDYVRLCAAAAEETGAEVVGGVIVARGRTTVERSVACAMDSPFGGIGFYRILGRRGSLLGTLAAAFGLSRRRHADVNGRVETDTLTFGAFRPVTFERAGLFDGSLRRNQDADLNLRVRKAGGRVVLDPAIRVYYTPRGSIPAVVRQYHEYGYWRVAVMVKHRQLPGPRTLTPLAFVASLAVLSPASTRSPLALRLLAAELALYGTLAVAAAATTVRRRGEPAALVPVVAAIFPAFHLGSGSGMLHGLARAALRAALTFLQPASRANASGRWSS